MDYKIKEANVMEIESINDLVRIAYSLPSGVILAIGEDDFGAIGGPTCEDCESFSADGTTWSYDQAGRSWAFRDEPSGKGLMAFPAEHNSGHYRILIRPVT